VVEVTGNKIGPGEVNCPKPGIVATRSYFGYRNIIPSQGRYVQNKKPETIYQSRIGTAYLAASRRSGGGNPSREGCESFLAGSFHKWISQVWDLIQCLPCRKILSS